MGERVRRDLRRGRDGSKDVSSVWRRQRFSSRPQPRLLAESRLATRKSKLPRLRKSALAEFEQHHLEITTATKLIYNSPKHRSTPPRCRRTDSHTYVTSTPPRIDPSKWRRRGGDANILLSVGDNHTTPNQTKSASPKPPAASCDTCISRRKGRRRNAVIVAPNFLECVYSSPKPSHTLSLPFSVLTSLRSCADLASLHHRSPLSVRANTPPSRARRRRSSARMVAAVVPTVSRTEWCGRS